MALQWQTGAVSNARGSMVQVCDVGTYSHAPLEDPDTPDHVITRDFADQSGNKARRAVQFQRYVEGTAHGEPWAVALGGEPATEPDLQPVILPGEEDGEPDRDDEDDE